MENWEKEGSEPKVWNSELELDYFSGSGGIWRKIDACRNAF